MKDKRQRMLALVAQNIARHGYHIWSVGPDVLPRFIYTVGLAGSRGAEVVFAGGDYCRAPQAARALAAVASGGELVEGAARTTEVGAFVLRRVSEAWTRGLLLGVVDHHEAIPRVLQMVPSAEHTTLDVPDMSTGSPSSDPVWRWCVEEWHGPKDAIVAARLALLRGARVTMVVRVSELEWHLGTAEDDGEPADDRVHICSLATALGLDPSLACILAMPVGGELRRSAEGSRWV